MRAQPSGHPTRSLGLALAVLAAMGCGAPRSATPEATKPRWLVIAPHPDDEALIASGVLLRATQAGAEANVIVMTNGDLDCFHDGQKRQAESVAGLRAVGLDEEHVYFLGYPDGGLAPLGRTPLPPRKRIVDGSCTLGNTTYGAHGVGRRDFHTQRFGTAATYTRENAIVDLSTLLAELAPTDVITTHPEDTHPDHAATYALLRSAIDRLPFAPKLHRAFVHNDDCWPTGTSGPCAATPWAPHLPTPDLSGQLEGYTRAERLEVPESCQLPEPSANPKLRAIAAHASQTRTWPSSYLFSFARKDELFFPESFTRQNGQWQRASSTSRTATVPLRLDDSQRYIVPLAPPLALAVDLPRPEPVAQLGFLIDRTGGYWLSFDAQLGRAVLERTFEDQSSVILHEWILPHDLWANGRSERFELGLDLRADENDAGELTLRWGDQMIGVAIDVRPRVRGEQIATSNLRTRDGLVTLHGGAQIRNLASSSDTPTQPDIGEKR